MIRSEIVLTIVGHPAPKGSMKCVGQRGPTKHVLVDSNENLEGWMAAITTWAKQIRQQAEHHEPLVVEVTSTLVRPKNHYRTGQYAGQLKPWAYDAWPVGQDTGDVDKLLRAVLDGLQAAPVLPNDAQVVESTTRKAYVEDTRVPDALEHPGAVIRIYPAQEA